MRSLAHLGAGLVLLSFSLSARAQPIGLSYADQVGQYGLLEVRFQIPQKPDNPYDPEEIALDGLFRTPSGREKRVPAFFCQTENPARKEADQQDWRIRFAPEERGRYTFSVVVSLKNGPAQEMATGAFDCTASQAGGFVRVAADSRHFRLSSGDAFFPVGANRCWGQGHTTAAYAEDMDRMARSGANCGRVWMAPWWIALEQTPGRYDQTAATRLDAILSEAEWLKLKMILCIEQHGNFEPEGGEIGLWKAHPYNAANGGPCRTASAFFTDDAARKLFQKRLRYIVARWGYSSSVMAWELFNEVEWVPVEKNSQAAQRKAVEDWHRAMGEFLRKNDPFGHLIATSSDVELQRALLAARAIDMLQLHVYTEKDIGDAFGSQMAAAMKDLKAPLFIGEFGLRKHGGVDSDYVSRGIFTAALGGFGAGALPWLQDTQDVAPCYARLAAADAFFRGVNWANEDFVSVTPAVAVPKDVTREEKAFIESLALLCLRGKQETLLYVYPRAPKRPPGLIPIGISIAGLPNGTYAMEAMNVATGKVLFRGAVEVHDAQVPIHSDFLATDIAIRLSRIGIAKP